MSTYYTCAVCGEPVTFDAPHSCAGAAPTSNLPEPQPFDIRDGKHRYAPCPACGATEGMGLATIIGSLAVECLCGFRGPGIHSLSTHSGVGLSYANECDRQAFEWWNLLPRPKPEREHGLVSLGEMNRRIAEAVAEAVAAERRAIVGICNEFMADDRWSEHAHMGARIVRGKILERAI